MKEHPIIFSGEMVRAILEGRKTQTRRVVKPQPPDMYKWLGWILSTTGNRKEIGAAIWQDELDLIPFNHKAKCPYEIGMRLWVRETCIYTPPCWASSESDYNIRDEKGGGRIIIYLADNKPGALENAKNYHLRVRPSIHMPRWASRITLEVVNVRVERIQDIKTADAKAEGVEIKEFDEFGQFQPATGGYVGQFALLWDEINAKRGFSWTSNPWVWVIEFKRAA